MTYRRIEQMVLAFGALAILGSVLMFAPQGIPARDELIAQALLFGVLLAAVRGGRRGGLLAAVGASIVYVLVSLPALRGTEPSVAELLAVVVRLLIFGAVGVVGGEFFMRLRYNLATLEGASALDEWSRVYNQRYLHSALTQAFVRHARYGEAVSVVVLMLSGPTLHGLTPSRQRALVRSVADFLRGNVRAVDEVARLDDGRFVVLLPHTPGPGGSVVAERIASGVRKVAQAPSDAVSARALTLPADNDELAALLASLAPEEPAYDVDASGR